MGITSVLRSYTKRKLKRLSKSLQQFSTEKASFLEMASTANFQVLLNNSPLKNHCFLLKVLFHNLNPPLNSAIPHQQVYMWSVRGYEIISVAKKYVLGHSYKCQKGERQRSLSGSSSLPKHPELEPGHEQILGQLTAELLPHRKGCSCDFCLCDYQSPFPKRTVLL